MWGPTPDEPSRVDRHVMLPRSDCPVAASADGRFLALQPFETRVVHVYDALTYARIALAF